MRIFAGALIIPFGIFGLGAMEPGAYADSRLLPVPQSADAKTIKQLTIERENLAARESSLGDAITAFNDKYGNRELPEDTAKEKLAERAHLEQAMKEYMKEADAYSLKAGSISLGAHIDDLKKAFDGDISAIRRLNLDSRAADFEEWEKLSTAAREEFKGKALDALFSTGLTAAQQSGKMIASQNPWKANEMVAALRKAGADDPLLLDAIKAVGAARDKPAKAKAVNEWLDAIGKAKDFRSMARDAEAAREPIEKRNARLAALATILSWGLENPKLSILATEIDLTATALLNNASQRVAAARIEQLNALAEADLKAVAALDRRLKENVKRLREAREAMNSNDLSRILGKLPQQTAPGHDRPSPGASPK